MFLALLGDSDGRTTDADLDQLGIGASVTSCCYADNTREQCIHAGDLLVELSVDKVSS